MVRFRPVSCLPDSKLSRMKSLWIHWFTKVENRCASRNLCCFGKRVRVSPFLTKKLRIRICLGFVTVCEWKGVSFLIFTWFWFGDLIWIFGMLQFATVSIDFCLNSEMNLWISLFSFSSSLNRFGFLEFSFLLLLNLLAVIVLDSLPLVMNSVLELQQARLNDEDSPLLNLWELEIF